MIWLVVLFLLPALPWSANRLAPALTANFLLRLRRRLGGLVDRSVTLSDGLRLVYSEGGAGEPLLLLHGLGADRSSFEAIAGLLSQQHHLIIPDLIGFGESDLAADGDYGIDAQVERIERFVGALGLQRFHLGGNSMGGWIAAAYAARFPDKVQSLWLLAAAGTGEMLETEAVRVRQSDGRYLLLARDAAEFDGLLERLFRKRPFLPFCFRHVGARRAAAAFALHARIFDQLLERGEEYRLEPLLPQVTAPTLLCWGEHDQVVPLTVMQSFHLLLPNSNIAVIPGVGHVPQMEAPKRAAADYALFRRRLGC
jgi:triacylglycerol lipase